MTTPKDPNQMSVSALRRTVTKLRQDKADLLKLSDMRDAAEKRGLDEIKRLQHEIERVNSQLRVLFSFLSYGDKTPTNIDEAVKIAQQTAEIANPYSRARVLARFLGDRIRLGTGDRPKIDLQVPWSLRLNLGRKFVVLSGTLPSRPRPSTPTVPGVSVQATFTKP